MKKIKSIILCFAIILSATLAGWSFAGKNEPQQSSAAVLPNAVFDYISLSQNGQSLNINNFKNIDNTTYIVANDNITINFKPFNYIYKLNTNNSNFYFYNQTIKVDFSENDRHEFLYENTKYFLELEGSVANFYRINVGGTMFMSTENNDLISIANQTSEYITLNIIKSATWKHNSPSTLFSFEAKNTIYSTPNNFTLNFNRPVINFANATNSAFTFTTTLSDSSVGSDSLLESEQEYSGVKLDFLSNDYSKINPLMFNINYNGFTYNFELYYEIIQSHEYLFVNYIDNEKTSNNRYLATKLDESGNVIYEVNRSGNNFFLQFEKTGRYELEVYDQTYLSKLNNCNYYKTSFYIKSNNVSAFENIYMIAQTYNDFGNILSYIVDDSTQNNSVQISIKNLTNLTSETGNPLELKNVIDKIEVLKTVYGASDNEHVSTTYSISQILQMIDKNTGDLILKFEEDADYDIIIYDKNSNAEISYSFTIAKKAKTHYTPSGQSEHRANILYHTEVINYTYNIDSTLPLLYGFGSNAPVSSNLNKNYVNYYTISYGMESVKIERVESITTDDDKDKKEVQELVLRFMGVGDIIAYVTFNGTTTPYNLNYEQGNSTLTFPEYGKYSISMVDSMGTTTSLEINYKKPTNISTIILIVLSAVIVAVVTFFILRARGKVKTR